ncbi:MAG: dioxygenase [Anaerolineae bacterium]|jgi:4,5-DOPA dioxygenase extradiol|nr:dioxygenase [Anaerolineae bacterium]MBT7326824.1 dioxygenase [Anaerolineae bacterium]
MLDGGIHYTTCPTFGVHYIIYLSHGGGPLPILGDRGHQAMVDFMTWLPSQLRKPDAILVISAHWEESVATLVGANNPPLYYDYYGFPSEAYEITYPASGHPALVERVAALLEKNNISSRIDMERGFDHGTFIPLKLMYPKADIPVIQLSLLRGLDSAAHIALGDALDELLQENILIIGSGTSFHNLNAFFGSKPDAPDPGNDAFQNWLIKTCTASLSQEEREEHLIAWEKAPAARYCHPREEHLLPLHVCIGMAKTPAKVVFDDQILGKRSVAFVW